MADVYTNIDEMTVLLQRQIELYQELKRALRLAELLGIPPKELKQKVSTTIRDTGPSSSYNPRPWLFKVLSVRVGDAPRQDFALRDVHHDLWPVDMKQAYAKWEKHKALNTNKE
jgi:hypothetical protein